MLKPSVALVRAAVACLASLAFAGPASAGQSWLAASDWEPRPGEEVRIAAHEGTEFQGDALSIRRGRVKKLLLRGEDETPLLAGEAAGDLARFLADDGGMLVALETEPSIERLEAGHLELLMDDEGLAGMKRTRADSSRAARVRTATCEKLWLGGNDSRRIREPAGLTLELVPRRDPSHVSSARVQLIFRGRPLAGALVKTWMQPLQDDGSPVAPAARLGLPLREWALTDSRGMVKLDVAARGEYLLSAMHAVPSRDANDAEWDAWRTSLTFARGTHRPWRSSEPRVLRGTGLGTNLDLGDPMFGTSFSRRDRPGWGRVNARTAPPR